MAVLQLGTLTVVEAEEFAVAAMQVVELSRRMHEAAVARNAERAEGRHLSAEGRARAAKRRELEALDQALELHELAARLCAELGRPEQAAAARERAERAQVAIVEAVRERDAAEELLARRHGGLG